MANIREINVRINTASGGGKLMVTYWNASYALGPQRAALRSFFDGLKTYMGSINTYFVESTGRVLDDFTGGLIGTWSDATLPTVTGTNGGAVVPDASQVLVRWTTGVVVGGRFVQGRSFIPGLAVTNLSGGNLLAATGVAFDAQANAMIATALGFGVWHRPVGGTGGQHVLASSATTWNELAVLRRRRG